ncbi:MAG: hypothetical protein RL186_30 [Pseudomonadota bacterium]
MSQAAATQILTAASCILLLALMLDPRCRQALSRLPNLRLALFGLAALLLTCLVQFAPLMLCMAPPPAWARADMVTIDPQWSTRAIVAMGASLAFFLIGAVLGVDPKRAKTLMFTLGLLLLVVFGLAVFDYWQETLRPRPSGAPDVLRLDGAFQSANTLASLWILGLLLSVGYGLAQAPRRGGRGRSPITIMSFVVGLVCFLGLLASMSRAGIAIGVVMLGVLGFVAWPERRLAIGATSLAFGVCIALVGIFGAQLGLPLRQIDLLGSVLTRLPEWQAALDLTLMRPCLGWGVGSFGLSVEAVRQAPLQSLSLVSVTPHNLFLLIVSETGIAGLVAWGVLASGLWRAARPAFLRHQIVWPSALALGCVGVILHNLVDFSLAVPATACAFSIVLGLLVSQAAVRPKKMR